MWDIRQCRDKQNTFGRTALSNVHVEAISQYSLSKEVPVQVGIFVHLSPFSYYSVN